MTYSLIKADALNLHLMRENTRIAYLATGQPEEKLRKTIARVVAEDMLMKEIKDLRDRCKWHADHFAENVKIPEENPDV